MNQPLENLPATAQTMAMKGGGYYSQRTRGAKDVIDNAVKMLLDAAQVVPEPSKGQPIRLADFGAADGGTSAAAWRKCIEHLRDRFTQAQIQVTYTDLPSNDFSSLFKNLLGFGSSGANTFLTDIENVFVNACGIGFHEQLLPDETLDIGFSATAMHYISEKPCTIDDHVHMVGASGDALAAFAQQAKHNWEDLLLARARELRPGGRLVILNFGIDEQGRYLGNTGGINMFNTFAELWSNMRNEGIISSDEFQNTAFPQYYRTVEEFCAPLKDQSSAVYQAGLRLVSAKTGVLGCPYRRAFDEAKGSMSNREFAVSYIPTLRSWSEAVFINGLSGERPQEEKDQIVDQFYQRYEDRVADNPDGHAMDYVHCYLSMEKAL
ncbi:class I SAM-dependent methyltransferase [Arenicellales bacterium IMCC55707]